MESMLDVDVQSFLTKSLKSRNLEILPLAGDASTRRYYRIVLDDKSWVLMSWEPFQNDGSYPFLSVHDHFEKHLVQVPKVVDLAPELGLVLLEDLGDLTLERKFWENQNQQLCVPFYKQAVDEMIKIHYPSTFDRNNCTAFKMEFNTERLLWEMHYGREHLLEKLCGHQLSGGQQKELESVFVDICETLDREPKFICHRDYHSRNLMIKLGKMRVIDFQDARMGPVQYDLVSLLKDSYVNLDSSVAEKLLQYYLEQRRSLVSSTLVRDAFDEIYEIQSIQRCFKACGSFASFYNLRKDTRYLKYLPQTLLRVRASLLKFPQFGIFLRVLEDEGLFERSFEAP